MLYFFIRAISLLQCANTSQTEKNLINEPDECEL
jgi:hypothetical protein